MDEDVAIDDILEEEAPPPEETPEQLKAKIKELQGKISETDAPAYKQLRSERDQLIDRYGKLTGYLEGAKIAKLNRETGEVEIIQAKQEQKDELVEIDSEIEKIEKRLQEKLDNDEITEMEYLRKIRKEVDPLMDKKRDITYQRKLEEKLKKEDTKPEVKPQVSVKSEFDKIAQENPDLYDKNSDLFKKMSEIYTNNYEKYKNANPGSENADPVLYKELLSEALGTKQKEKGSTNSFSEPSSKDTVIKPKSFGLNQSEVNLMTISGYSNKNLIKSVASAMDNYRKTGVLVCD
jgi:hypothetical protein